MRRLSTILVLLALISCSGGIPEDLQRAEHLLKDHPDSAKLILESSPCAYYEDGEVFATWALLNVWADYKLFSDSISISQLEYATDYFIEKGSHLRKAQAYYLKASVNSALDEESSSEWMDEYYLGCLEAEKSGDDYIAALLYQHYGAELNNRQWYDEGLEAMEKSFRHAEKTGSTELIVATLINICHCQLYHGDEIQDYSTSIKTAEKACAIARDAKDDNSYSRALSALASCHSRNDEYEVALKYSKESVDIQERLYKSGIRKDPVRHLALAEVWMRLGNADSCIYYARLDENSPSIITRIGSAELIYQTSRELLHNDSMALEYADRYNRLCKEKEAIDNNGLITRERLRIEEDFQKKRQQNLILTFFFSLLVLIAIFSTIITLYKLRINHLDKREDELSKKRDNMAEKVVDMSGIVRHLRTAPKYLDDEEWPLLEKTIDDAYDGYCTKLKSQGFTPSNIRVAILMKLRFSTSDAARILAISPASYTKAKQRLKSKLTR